ncbi:helix-turn-helix domain-containing protein [Tenacibaculum sp. C7A-26P2]|uniref:helix-turn-helix domain-containing protein n=1 Tax=Tenacibaculum sp. C7A-26P2 TaxID=3447504 RepID=UPI003F873E62
MSESVKINSILELHNFLKLGKPLHPYISLVKSSAIQSALDKIKIPHTLNLYQISLTDIDLNTIAKYGDFFDDLEGGIMSFQMVNRKIKEIKKLDQDEGWYLFFHPDLIRKVELSYKIDSYPFFSCTFEGNLMIYKEERQTISTIVENIKNEIGKLTDVHTQVLVVLNIELLLNYCLRCYDRQFYTLTNRKNSKANKFRELLEDYYKTDRQLDQGVPTVQYLAELMNVSSKYLSHILRKETGQGAQDHIHNYVLKIAKNRLLHSDKSVNTIAYELGFEYPQYFNRMFKKKTKVTPNKYRLSSV